MNFHLPKSRDSKETRVKISMTWLDEKSSQEVCEKALALQGWEGSTQIPPAINFLGAAPSHSLTRALLPATVPACSWVSVPTPPACSSQPPSHPLGAQLCPADTSWQQGSAQGQLAGDTS